MLKDANPMLTRIIDSKLRFLMMKSANRELFKTGFMSVNCISVNSLCMLLQG